jgi:hypothetical protein
VWAAGCVEAFDSGWETRSVFRGHHNAVTASGFWNDDKSGRGERWFVLDVTESDRAVTLVAEQLSSVLRERVWRSGMRRSLDDVGQNEFVAAVPGKIGELAVMRIIWGSQGGTTDTETKDQAPAFVECPDLIVDDPPTDWRSIGADLPIPNRTMGTAVIGGYLYVVGGDPAHCGMTNRVFGYHLATNTWSEAASLSAARNGVGVAASATG